MKTTFNLCGRKNGCCPTLVTSRNKKKLSFKIADDYDGEVQLTRDQARLLAFQILEELGKK